MKLLFQVVVAASLVEFLQADLIGDDNTIRPWGRLDTKCVAAGRTPKANSKLRILKVCDVAFPSAQWMYSDSKRIKLMGSPDPDLCWTAGDFNKNVKLSECDESNSSQVFEFDNASYVLWLKDGEPGNCLSGGKKVKYGKCIPAVWGCMNNDYPMTTPEPETTATPEPTTAPEPETTTTPEPTTAPEPETTTTPEPTTAAPECTWPPECPNCSDVSWTKYDEFTEPQRQICSDTLAEWNNGANDGDTGRCIGLKCGDGYVPDTANVFNIFDMATYVYACINGQYIISNGYIETWGTLAMLTAHCKPKIEPQCEAEIHENYGTHMIVFGPEMMGFQYEDEGGKTVFQNLIDTVNDFNGRVITASTEYAISQSFANTASWGEPFYGYTYTINMNCDVTFTVGDPDTLMTTEAKCTMTHPDSLYESYFKKWDPALPEEFGTIWYMKFGVKNGIDDPACVSSDPDCTMIYFRWEGTISANNIVGYTPIPGC